MKALLFKLITVSLLAGIFSAITSVYATASFILVIVAVALAINFFISYKFVKKIVAEHQIIDQPSDINL